MHFLGSIDTLYSFLPDALSPHTAQIPLFIDDPGMPSGECAPWLSSDDGDSEICDIMDCDMGWVGIPEGPIMGLMSSCDETDDTDPILLRVGDCMACGCIIPPCTSDGDVMSGGEPMLRLFDIGGGEPIVLVGDWMDVMEFIESEKSTR